MAQVLSFRDVIDAEAAKLNLAGMYTFLNDAIEGMNRSVFLDVDEKALKKGEAAVTNVYFDFGNGRTIKVLSQQNTGVKQDRRISASGELWRAMLEAFNLTPP
jgi:hypothetical protein